MKTYIETFWWDIYEINMDFEDFLKYEKVQKSKWETDLILKDYQVAIKFTDIKKKTGKRSLFSPDKLPPSGELIEDNKRLWPGTKTFTSEERKNIEEQIRLWLEKTFENRRKNFLLRREEILKELARDEERFWLDTTISKLEELNRIKNKDLINNLW